MASKAEKLTRARSGLVAGSILLVLGSTGLFIVAATRATLDDQGVWFTAMAAGLAVLGLLGAAVAVYFALPGYLDLVEQQRARPVPELRFQFPDPLTGEWVDVQNGVASAPHRTFSARVLVTNDGDAVLRWGILNIQAPIDCGIEPEGGKPDVHSRSHTPFISAELFPGETRPCNATVVERDFPPVHTFIYNVRVTPPAAGRWPLAAVLDGYPAVRGSTRVVVEVP